MGSLSSGWFALALGASALGACMAAATGGAPRPADEGSGGSGGLGPDLSGGDDAPPENLPPEAGESDPHAVLGAEPSHGPFTGGQRVLIHGKGFSSKARVWFGGVEVDPKSVLPVDPSRVQVVAPPGVAGAVEVAVQNGDDASTRRAIAAGYSYDALYAEPASGPVSGGTVIHLFGQGTSWDASTVVKIDQKPCASLEALSLTELACTTPPGSPGAKTVAVAAGGEASLVLDAYTYEDTENGYKGGLSGAPLAGHLKVLALDNYSGAPIPGAFVIVGAAVEGALAAVTDASGVGLLNDASLTKPVTVTVAARCHSPVTFVDAPVDTATVYLDPVLALACATSGDLPPTGGKSVYPGVVKGELVWPMQGEFKRGHWSNVPEALGPNEKRAAYLFAAQSEPTVPFQLPPPGLSVTETAPGSRGYAFSLAVSPGNRALYALAGIEDRSKSPPRFTAYAMGVVKGVPVLPSGTTEAVYIAMSTPLDQALTLDVASPPPGPKGPDRLRATVSVRLGNDGYAALPVGSKTPLLPFQGALTFVGLPPLDGELAYASYVATARAQTGVTGIGPLSVIGQMSANTTSQPLPAKGFVAVPTLVSPAVNAAWDGQHLATTFPPGGAAIDLTVYDIQSGDGLVHWVVSVPRGSHAIDVPDLRLLPEGALPPGPLSISVYGARIDGFNYARLRSRDLRPQGMSAYALDTFSAHL